MPAALKQSIVQHCRTCDQTADFTRQDARECRECAKTRVRAWREANPEKYRAGYQRDNNKKEQRRAALIESRYGITVAQYEQMLEDQAGCCKVCSTGGVTLDIDHDHATGEVRGLLCRRCNLTLGLYNDNADHLEALASYLRGTL